MPAIVCPPCTFGDTGDENDKEVKIENSNQVISALRQRLSPDEKESAKQNMQSLPLCDASQREPKELEHECQLCGTALVPGHVQHCQTCGTLACDYCMVLKRLSLIHI